MKTTATERMIWWVLAAVVAFWICIGVLLFQALEEIGERGLRAVVMDIWEGSENADHE